MRYMLLISLYGSFRNVKNRELTFPSFYFCLRLLLQIYQGCYSLILPTFVEFVPPFLSLYQTQTSSNPTIHEFLFPSAKKLGKIRHHNIHVIDFAHLDLAKIVLFCNSNVARIIDFLLIMFYHLL